MDAPAGVTQAPEFFFFFFSPPFFCGACVNFLSREGFSHPFPSSTVKSNFVYPRRSNRSPLVGRDVRENPSLCDHTKHSSVVGDSAISLYQDCELSFLRVIEFRCVVTVSTPAVWLARENIKRLTPRPCINVEYSYGVVYIEEEWTTSVFH